MTDSEQKLLVSHLDGYIRAVTSIDGHRGDSIGCVFTLALDGNNIRGSLENYYQGLVSDANSNDVYRFGPIENVPLKHLHEKLEKLFFRCPFSLSHISTEETVVKARYDSTWNIIELTRILVEDNFANVYRMEAQWLRNDTSYNGCIFVFPCGENYLIIKVLSKQAM